MQVLHFFSTALVLFAYYYLGVMIASYLPLPAALIGLLLLLVTFVTLGGVPKFMRLPTSKYLRHMILFYLPPVLAVYHQKQFFIDNALALFLAIVVSTIMAMGLATILAKRLLKGVIDE